MFGPKIRNVFRSRWNALFWSLSVLLTAYCSVPSPEAAKTGGEDPAAVEKIARQLMPAKPAEERHVNPWAKTAD